MTVVVASASPAFWDRDPRARPSGRRVLVAAAVVALVAVAAVLRLRALSAPYWIDEGISVGISSHPLGAIPGALRQDGSPPLYYLLLHVWMALFGSAPSATHALSAGLAIACVPAAWWAVAPFGTWAGLVAGGLMALDPFVGLYADETRMYSLLLLIALLVCGAFLRAFVLRRRAHLASFAILLALALYVHPWGAFLVAAAGLAWLALLAVGPSRRTLARDGVLAFGGGGAALRAVGADPALPGRPHRRAVVAPPDRPVADPRPGPHLERAAGRARPAARRGRGARDRGAARRRQAGAPRRAGRGRHRGGDAARRVRLLARRDRRVGAALPGRGARAAGAARRPSGSAASRSSGRWRCWRQPCSRGRGDPPSRRSSTRATSRRSPARSRPRCRAGTLVFSTQPEQVPELRASCPRACATERRWGRVADARRHGLARRARAPGRRSLRRGPRTTAARAAPRCAPAPGPARVQAPRLAVDAEDPRHRAPMGPSGAAAAACCAGCGWCAPRTAARARRWRPS